MGGVSEIIDNLKCHEAKLNSLTTKIFSGHNNVSINYSDTRFGKSICELTRGDLLVLIKYYESLVNQDREKFKAL